MVTTIRHPFTVVLIKVESGRKKKREIRSFIEILILLQEMDGRVEKKERSREELLAAVKRLYPAKGEALVALMLKLDYTQLVHGIHLINPDLHLLHFVEEVQADGKVVQKRQEVHVQTSGKVVAFNGLVTECSEESPYIHRERARFSSYINSLDAQAAYELYVDLMPYCNRILPT